MGEPFAEEVRWPIESGSIRLRMSDRFVARLPGLMRRLMTRFLAEPAGSRARRWVIDRGLLAGFAATDASDWDWLSRVYEPDMVLQIADDALPDLPSRLDGFAALPRMFDEARDVLQAFDSRPVEIVDLGGRHFAAVVEHGFAGTYSGAAVSGKFMYLYEMSDAGRVARQWWTADPATAEAFHRERLAQLNQETSDRDRPEQVRFATDALNAGDFEALAAVFHADLEHHSAFAAVEGEVYRGIEGQRRRWDNVTSTWDHFRIEVVETREVDEQRLVVVLALTGEAKASRLPLDTRLAQVWTWREGMVWRIATYTNPSDALEAVGLPG